LARLCAATLTGNAFPTAASRAPLAVDRSIASTYRAARLSAIMNFVCICRFGVVRWGSIS
jgi:hypothetical protein